MSGFSKKIIGVCAAMGVMGVASGCASRQGVPLGGITAQTTVLLMGFEAMDLDGDAGIQFRRAVYSVLKEKGVAVVGPEDIERMLGDDGYNLAQCQESSACRDELLGALGADELLYGAIGRLGSTWVVTATRIERRSSRVLGRASRQMKNAAADTLAEHAQPLVQSLFGDPKSITLSWSAGKGVAAF